MPAITRSRPVSVSDWGALGYRCKTVGCTGHNKGWEWGELWGVEDEDYGEGFSESFNEGVQAYARFMKAALGEEVITGGGGVR